MPDVIHQILAVIRLAEQLKRTLRHSWLSDGRHESVAEHTWRMSLMALLIAPHLDVGVNVERLLKMVVVHDLVEAIAGDVPVFDVIGDSAKRTRKKQQEIDAMEKIAAMLPQVNAEEVAQLWADFEESSSIEAKVAQALDKLEAQIQHNEAPLTTWLESEFNLMNSIHAYTEFDRFLDAIRSAVVQETIAKIDMGRTDHSSRRNNR